jgi:hypothetical protein
MKTLQVITGVLIATATISSAQLALPTLPPLPQRPGTMQELSVQPENPTSAMPVTIRVRMNHQLLFDRSETQTNFSMITVKVYWKSSPIGGVGVPSQQSVSLGTLAAGRYTVYVQSFYEGRFTDMEHLSIQVTEGALPTDCMEEVYIVPDEPTTSTPVMLHVEGKWPTAGHQLSAVIKSTINNHITVSMHWTSPTGHVIQVETPYHKTTSLGPLQEGMAYLTVRCYLDDMHKATKILTFEVAPGGGWWPWDGWPF